ncbi:MAG: cytochrome-c oxidase, cbb3-type subunit I [Deltaproteobacteria bacterium]|nr:cytochrome-c oxidase, cbb3-type subunit I [Deltaproteobacteria bacterium]
MNTQSVTITYDDDIVRKFVSATILWGVVGMLVGVIIASELAWPELGLGVSWLGFGRLRPLHTNAVIFAFVGNMMFAGVYYSTQRLTKTVMPFRALSLFHFWGWQAIIVSAALTLPFGITQSKEYAELEWPIDIAVTLVWVAFAINFFGALYKRNEKNLYVALWFYISTVLTIAVLYIVNNLSIPVSATKSYVIWAGVQDALVQWWYGHNAVAFFLTTPILGIMYYFLPKAADRPVFSYRLSIVHFWGLVFLYIWAGPHHLLYTALPDWAQSLGMIFSLMLWAPSWGGMLNGLLTLKGHWDRLRQDPIIKFYAAAVTFYGMSTFEGPLMSIKSVNGLAHYTDWVVGHAHGGALGWNGFMAAGMLYWIVPKLWNKPLHSVSLANTHFWVGTLGILLYIVSMWVSGITQGLMWKALTPDGALVYPNFVETLVAIRPMYITRMIGGLLYLTGFCIMVYNLLLTIKGGQAVNGTIDVVTEQAPDTVPATRILLGRPMIISVVGVGLILAMAWTQFVPNMIISAALIALVVYVAASTRFDDSDEHSWHHILEGKSLIFSALVLVGVLIGGAAEIIPTVVTNRALPEAQKKLATVYRPLELHGRDIYVREGCYNCHSQMIRPMPNEALRYGEPSTIADSYYDHPFQWGSKRTGPDLARVGGKYPNQWHYEHFMNPRTISAGSNMPEYAFLKESRIDRNDTTVKLHAMQTLGVPYTAQDVGGAAAELEQQARAVADDLGRNGVKVEWDSELVALIAYVQRLGAHPAAPAGARVSLRTGE